MSEYLNRRKFLKNSLIVSAGVTGGLSFEEQDLLARNQRRPSAGVPEGDIKGLPIGKIGNVKISRLICGGNLINGYPNNNNFIYLTSLFKNYFTDEKSIETLQISEENGINTCIMNVEGGKEEENSIRILKRYWKEGGKIQWIAQCNSYENDLTRIAKKAIDNGAVGAFIQGVCGDNFIKNGSVDLVGKVVSFIKDNGLIAGVGSHVLEMPIAIEKEGIEVDFYFKTLNEVGFQCVNPKKTIEFMKKVTKPWIAFKVLAAGSIHPRTGFKYAFDMGADFINIGMFDFQIKEDIMITKRALSDNSQRERPWRG